jgi:hypothetical protein
MLEYLKYLPLLQIASNHPNMVTLFNQIAAIVQPHMTEIEQTIAEAEAMLQRIVPPQGQPHA